MKVLLTGSTGFLGSRALAFFREGHTVGALPSALLRGEWTAARREQLYAAVCEQRPTVIFHTAAISNIEAAERDPQASYQANVALPLALAQVAARLKCKLVCCSSDQVYNGSEGLGAFTEDAPLAPTQTYGRHKLEAEARVADAAPDAVSLRLSWMYDMPAYGMPSHRNLLVNLLLAAARGQTLRLYATDRRGVTYVRQAVANLPAAFALPGGVYNFGSESTQSTYGIAQAWCQAMGLDPAMLAAAEGEPRNLCMDCGRIRQAGILFDGSAEGIRRCLADHGLSGL